MGKINTGRVILGGLIAGLIFNIFEDVLNGWYLANVWPEVMRNLGLPKVDQFGIIEFNLMGFLLGIAAVWIYAAIRPRFGAGPRTAVYAGILTWFTAVFVGDSAPSIMGVYPMATAFVLVVVGLVECVVGTLAGAYFYKEA
jgi:hypothetical protein